MTAVALHFFGPGVIEIDGSPVAPRSLKTLGLLCYLVLEHDRPHDRSRLAALFWPDLGPSSARHNLRQSLHWLRQVGGRALRERIAVSNELVQWRRGAAVPVDVLRFLDGVREHGRDAWRDAAAAHRAPLLEGRCFDACDAFAEWLAAMRISIEAIDAQNRRRLGLVALPGGSLRPGIGVPGPVDEATGGPPCVPQALGDERTDTTPASLLVAAARAAARVHAFGHALDLLDRALAVVPALPPPDLLEVLLLKESMLDRLGRRAEQWVVIAQARTCAATLDDPTQVAQVLLRQASACAYADRFDEGLECAHEALARYRAAADHPGEAESLRELGFLCWRADDPRAALGYAQQALALHRRLGDTAGEASALHNLAEIHRGLGSPRQALREFEQALDLHWSVKSAAGEVLSQFGSASAWMQLGEDAMAERQYRAALRTSERLGERTMQARSLQALARHRACAGAVDDALGLLRAAIAIDRAINYAHALGHDLLDLARLLASRGERIEARAALGEATVWFDSLGDAPALAQVRARLAQLDAGEPDADDDAAAGWIRSHLPLAEGKAYCAFESPIATSRRGPTQPLRRADPGTRRSPG
ncbi:MAG: tetratricopeptide repeat protein [Lautropia sp.]